MIAIAIIAGSGSAALMWRNANQPRATLSDTQAQQMGFTSAASSDAFHASEERMESHEVSQVGLDEQDFRFVQEQLMAGGKPALRTISNLDLVSKPEQRRRIASLLDQSLPTPYEKAALLELYRRWDVTKDKGLLAMLRGSRNKNVSESAQEYKSYRE